MMELRVPAAGDAVSEVKIGEWLAKDGDTVKEGDLLYTIETDKAVLEIQAPADGQLSIGAPAGAVLKVGDRVGRID